MPRVTFHPQAWIRDHAVDVDPEGETSYEVTTEEALAASRDLDSLARSPSAPEWVRSWKGPFRVTVDEEEDPGLLAELKELLARHRASIDYDFSPSADTHGLCDSGLAIYVDGKLVRSFPHLSSLDASDL